ncbi:diguanylate cyclase domain-containing protein [Leucothrix arctica]|uniref:Sensor domain-containing diguanylate cyclase n=1 Tax=Leucothrix arctica TaxID=1481894 RepID=A0A317C8E0_9GAMM|nr:diguanylate cyclase [Leucothrix arctica]PWQ94748.1 hypothetical protein DKT75_15800 [Leucothrix arctica]
MRIKFKLALPSVIGLVVTIVLIHNYWEPIQLKKAKAHFTEHTQELLVATESGIIQQLLERDLGALYSSMDYIKETYQNRWLNIKLYNENKKLIYPLFEKKRDATDHEDNILHVVYPLKMGTSELGQFEVDVDWSHEKELIQENLKSIRDMIILTIILILFINTLSQYRIIYRPLKKLIEATNKITLGDFNVQLPKVTPDEIGALTNSFSVMSAELTFQKHVVDEHAIVSTTDKNGLITSVNRKFVDITGYSRKELIGKTHNMIRTNIYSPTFFKEMWETITQGKVWRGELCNLNKKGEEYWVSASIVPCLDDHGKPERYIAIRTEITKQKKAEQRLKYLADHDTLTGLPMRRVFQEKLMSALAIARRNHSKAAVLFIDLDGFKNVNDTLGHNIGDILLMKVAERLTQCIREVDTVARLGGDEFIIVLSDIQNRDDVSAVAQKIIDTMSASFTISGEVASIGASVGIALYPDHEKEPGLLIKKADDMMYAVKRKGKNNFAFYDDVSEVAEDTK